MRPRALPSLALLFVVLSAVSPYAQQLRKIGEMELALVGLSATVDGARPAIPKNVASGVKVLVSGGGSTLAPGAVARLLGSFSVEAELSGPSFGETVTVRQAVTSSSTQADLVLPLPAMAISGEHTLSNLRIVADPGDPQAERRSLLDLTPHTVPVDVIEQVLITSVRTRPLTLQEIKDKGIVLDSDDYLGFEFTLGVLLESKPINIAFPVVFDREGVVVPLPQSQSLHIDTGSLQEPVFPPKIVPVMIKIPKLAPGFSLDFPVEDIRIPSLLVIPGEVGYLKQFFSAQLFVGNGTPGTANLTVRDLRATIELPDDPDPNGVDPLSLAETVNGIQPLTMTVAAVGPDGLPATADDVTSLKAGEQGQAEFLVRGDEEGFHNIAFNITGMLDGLPTGPLEVTGRATGGVLVRNPFFDVAFTLPTVVRANEPFKLYATVTNKGEGIANDVSMTIDAASMSGVRLLGDGTLNIETLMPGEAETLVFDFEALRTGQAVATYLRFEGPGATGSLKFKVGLGERGVPLSPDTLVLPAQIDELPSDVVLAAMRVLGQAWSIANTPPNAMPPGVTRISKPVVTNKALALAEAGLRITLGQPKPDAIRDLLPDFYGPAPIDRGFDQLLRMTDAGRNFNRAVGAALAPTASSDPGGFEAAFAGVAASGREFISFSIGNGGAGADVDVRLSDAANRVLTFTGNNTDPRPAVTAAAIAPLGDPQTAPLFGLVAVPASAPYTLELTARGGGTVDVSITYPRGDGFARGTAPGVSLAAGAKARVVIDPAFASPVLAIDADANGTVDSTVPLSLATVPATGPRLLTASVVGPETFPSAGPWGLNVALLFDRIVNGTAAAELSRYTIPDNRFTSASRQLSGRLVLGSLAFPEGPYVPTSVTVASMPDLRGAVVGVETRPMQSLLVDPGAVISGRIINGNGQLAAGVRVLYPVMPDWLTCQSPDVVNLAAAVTDASGRYEYRYIRKDKCGPWTMRAIDEVNQSQRSVSGSVRSAGERITADIALLGRGAVTGIVRDFSGAPVPDAQVIAVSSLEPQIGGSTRTDGDGRYTIYGITVGPVSVKAAKGQAVGAAAGQIPRAGTTGSVDVTLNSGTVSISGVVKAVENGVATPVAGAIVIYDGPDPLKPGSTIVVGATTSDADGNYAFTAMPSGGYTIRVKLPSGDGASITGTASPNDELTERHILVPVLRNATVSGRVLFPDGSVVPNPVVTLSSRGVLGETDGTFTIENVLVSPNPQTIQAHSLDGLREGRASVLLNQSGQHVSNVVVTLNGIGTLDLLVLDPLGQPVRNQIVQISKTGHNISPTDCTAFYLAPTDEFGRVQFAGLEVGVVKAVSIRATANGVDIAKVETNIPYEGATVSAVMRFGGGGVVRGTVRDDQGAPVFGANIEIHSRIYNSQLCALWPGVSHRLRTDLTGQYRVTGVPVGQVNVSASQEFFPTPVGKQGVLARDGDELVLDLTLIHTTAGKMTGTVFLPDGVTPAGAGVALSAIGALPEVLVTTNAEGEFAFPKIFPAGAYTVTVRDPITGGVVQERVVLSAHEDLVHDFRLKGRGTVHVKVVDGAGEAVSNALVTLKESEYPHETFEAVVEESNEGVVTFTNVNEGDFSVSASDENGRGGRVSGEIPAPGATVESTVRLTVTGTVTGRFLMPDGVTAIPFGALKLFANSRIIGNSTSESGEHAGAYTFYYVPAGTVKIEALDPATGRSGVAIGQITTDGQVLTLDVHAQGLGTVNGRVTHNGLGEDGANVSVSSGTFKAQTTADQGGNYSVPGVPEGIVTVKADRRGTLPGTASGTLLGDGGSLTVDVALQASGTVVGVVTAADGVTPAPPSIVTLMAGSARYTATTDDLGAYRFDLVPAGTRTISVDVIGSIDTTSATVSVVGGETATVPLQLNGVGTITGVAQNANGVPVGGTVTLTGNGPIGYSMTLTVNPDGSFIAAQVLAGPFTAQVRHTTGGITLYGTATGVVAPGGTTNIVVTLQSTGTVTGTVRRSDGTTAAVGAAVTLKSGGSVVATTQAFSDGGFSFTGLPLGTYTIAVFDLITNGHARALNLVLAENGDEAPTGVLVLDTTAPTATVTPEDGATGVSRTQPIVVTFSDPVTGTGGVNVKKGTTSLGATRVLSADGLTLTLTGTWSDSSEITVEVTTSVTDVFGRHPAATITSRFFTVDTTAPTVTAMTPADDAYEVAGNSAIVVTFSESIANASVAGLVNVTRAGIAVTGTAVLGPANVVTFTPDAALADDSVYAVSVDGAVDATGNEQGAAFTASFATTDTVPPVLTIAAPSIGSWITDATPFISITRTDATSGNDAASGTILLDGVAVTPSKSAGSFSYTVPAASALADGTHTIDATSADRAGKIGQVQGAFMLDATDPAAPVITAPPANETVRGSTTITATATDATSGVARIEIRRGPNLIHTLLPPTFSGTENFGGTADGEYFLTARAYDVAGNAGPDSAPLRIIVDNDLLELAITQPVENFRTRKPVVATATTNEPVERVEFTLGGITVTDTEGLSPHSATLPVAAMPDDDATLTVRAFGLLGEVVTETRKIVIDRSSPVARWPFDEGTGTTAADASGNLHTGTLVNGTAWDAAGLFGKAIALDGLDDAVSVADSDLLDVTDAITMAGWVWPAAPGAPRSVIFKNGAYSLALAADGRVEAVVYPNGVAAAVTSVTPVAADAWTHLAATYDGTMLRLYVDGAEVSTVAASGPLATTGGGVWLGRAEVTDTFNGKLDEIRIYDRALLATEVQKLAERELFGSRLTAQFRGSYFGVPGGPVYAFGQHNQGSLGLGNASGQTPAQMPGLTDIVAITARNTHGHVLTRAGALYGWGNNIDGNVGDNSTSVRSSAVPVNLDGVVSIADGVNHGAAVRSNGDAFTWGTNTNGQLGDNSLNRSLAPQHIMTGVRAVAAGHAFTIFVKNDGTVWGAGTNSNGQLGDNTKTQRLSPVQMIGITDAVDAAAGLGFTIIRLADGTLRAVGQSGKMGDGSNVDKTLAVPVPGLTDVVRLAAGANHVLALRADGTVWAWGNNTNGSLGDGTSTQRLSVIQVPGLANIADIGAGDNQSLAVTESGRVYTWGENGFSELGDGADRNRFSPTAITADNYVLRVSTPTYSDGTNTYSNDRNVLIRNVMPGVTMHYTRTGAEPTEADAIVAHNTTILVNHTQTLKVKAFKAGMPPSNTEAQTFTMKVAFPGINPNTSSNHTQAQTVTLTTPGTTGATIYYNLVTGTAFPADPTEASTLYTGPFVVSTESRIKVRGFRPGFSPSEVHQASFNFQYPTPLPAPVISPAGGAFDDAAIVTLTAPGAPAGSTIRWMTTSSFSTCTQGTPYNGPVPVAATGTLRARTCHVDYAISAQSQATFTITAAAPVFNPPAGNYPAGTKVMVTGGPHATEIRYTINGADPTTTSPLVPAGGITLGDFTLKARAFQTDAADSAVTSATYSVSGALSPGSVAAADSHSFAVTPDGRLFGWGDNTRGQIGDGSAFTDVSLPWLNSDLTGVIAAAGGFEHSLFLTADHRLWSVGFNTSGQLADGTNATQRLRLVPVPALSGVVAIAAGGSHSVALLDNGDAYTWGAGSTGQLGIGTTAASYTPVLAMSGVMAIGAGPNTSLFVKTDGTVWGTGANTSGQLGDGTTTNRTTPVQMTGISGAVAVSGGGNFTVVRLADGTVRATGGGSRIGDSTTSGRTTAVPVLGLTDVIAVDAGESHTLALKSDGTVWAWGINGSGQLGLGTQLNTQLAPVQTPGLANVAGIAAGSTYSLAVTADRVVYSWGSNSDSRIGDGSTRTRPSPTPISAADFAWKVSTPRLSANSGTYTTSASVVVSALTPGATIHYTQNGAEPTESDPVIASGATLVVETSQVLTAKAFKAGMPPSNTESQIYEIRVDQPSIFPVPGSYTVPLAVTMSTTTPGAAIYYTLDGTEPTEASILYPASGFTIATPGTFSVRAKAFKAGTTPSSLRINSYTLTLGQLPPPGISSASGTYQDAVPLTLTSIPGASIYYTTNNTAPVQGSPSIPYSGPFSLSKTATLRVKAFHPDYVASNESSATYTVNVTAPTLSLASGEYGPGTTSTVTGVAANTIRITLDGVDPIATSASVPSGRELFAGNYTVKVRAFTPDGASSAVVSATYSLSAALSTGTMADGNWYATVATPDGRVFTWGQNSNGVLGDGTTSFRKTPAVVHDLTGVTAVSAQGWHNLALTWDGRVYAWGDNAFGQIGDGTTIDQRRPVLISSLTNVVQVSAGIDHSLALTSDGQVYAWGTNFDGQLGIGSTTPGTSSTPLLVPGLANIAFVAAGDDVSYAVTAAGEVYAWGQNFSGEIGDGTVSQRSSPTLVSGLTNVEYLDGTGGYVLARVRDGRVFAWGENSGGYYGDGTTIESLTPVVVPWKAVEIDTGLGVFVRDAGGALLASGTNFYGNLGDGTFTNRLSPVTVGVPAGISTFRVGQRSMAVTHAGGVYTWGRSDAGFLLGDSFNSDRATPTLAFTLPGLWAPPPATFSVPAGSYANAVTVVVSSPLAGATIRYTLDGSTPTDSSPIVPATGEILITASSTLRARVFDAGRLPSAVTAATYEITP